MKYNVKQVLVSCLAIMLALLGDHYFFHRHTGLVALSAFLASQQVRGRPWRWILFFFATLCSVAILFSFFYPVAIESCLLEIVVGALIGGILQQLFLSPNLYMLFTTELLPVFLAFKQSFLKPSKSSEELVEIFADIGKYPEWVYAIGFNPGFRPSFRFFLIRVEWVSEILFALKALLPKQSEMTLLHLAPILERIEKSNLYLLNVLIERSQQITVQRIDYSLDFKNDILLLEEALDRFAPISLEILLVDQAMLPTVALVRTLKDLREILLVLVEAFV